jgi:hypothetical protein
MAWQVHMQSFTGKIVRMKQSENLYASHGAQIRLSHVLYICNETMWMGTSVCWKLIESSVSHNL